MEHADQFVPAGQVHTHVWPSSVDLRPSYGSIRPLRTATHMRNLLIVFRDSGTV